MEDKNAVSRRKFVGGLAAALGYVSTGPDLDVFAQGRAAGQGRPAGAGRGPQTAAQYDAMAKLANNENNWGIPDSVMKAMEGTGSTPAATAIPTRGSNAAIAEFDGVKPENVMITAGSGEVLDVVGTTFLQGGKKVLGRRAVLQLRLPARHQHQVRSDQAAADEGLSSGHRHGRRR